MTNEVGDLTTMKSTLSDALAIVSVCAHKLSDEFCAQSHAVMIVAVKFHRQPAPCKPPAQHRPTQPAPKHGLRVMGTRVMGTSSSCDVVC